MWEFPPGVTLAASGDAEGKDYLLVFASDRDDADYPYVDDDGYLHTNFALSKGGESVLLVEEEDGTPTISHGYLDYLPQITDVSYGFHMGATWNTLVPADAPLSYHVPTPGDAFLLPIPDIDPGWTAWDFDDSSWTDSVVYGAAGIVITEINTGDEKFVEIQNVSDEAIDTSGLSVLINDATSGNINDVNDTAWNLSGPMASGAVDYRTDSSGDRPWGSDILWAGDGPGWAMIVDQAGNVMDFVAWGYDESEIDSLQFDYGELTDITVGDQWHGDGALPGAEAPGVKGVKAGVISYAGGTYSEDFDSMGPSGNTPPTGWIAGKYSSTQNRQPPGSAPNSESLYVDDGSSTSKGRSYNYGTSGHSDRALGHLATTSTGDRAVQLAISNNTGAEITEFTFEYTGEQWRDWDGDPGDSVQKLTLWYSTSPGSGFVDMGRAFDFNAPQQNDGNWVLCGNDPANRETISGTVTPAGGIPNGQTFYITWHDQNDSGVSDHPLAVDDFSFTAVYGPRNALSRIDHLDTESAVDFERSNDPSKGVQNSALTVPFGVVIPTIAGIGFSNNQPSFEDAIQTKVGEQMQGQNASLWTRIEFEADDLSAFSGLTLKMKYDDGFVAYLNGVAVADQNAPGPLAYDSAAEAAHPDLAAVVFEDFDVTGHLGELRFGTNVLAIHGLNVEAADEDLLIQAKLMATADMSPPRFFGHPTPGEVNDPSAGAPTESVSFSRGGGTFTDSSISVELSVESSEAVIRYTTNGTAPTETSPVYPGPLTINSTTQVRARAYQSGREASPITGETYVKLASDAESFTSDLPIVVLENFGGSTPGGSSMVDFHMAIFEPQDDGRSALTNDPEVSTRIGLKKRGSSSSGWPKSHYRLETRDQDDDDLALGLLGMPRESDWVLNGPWTDKALIRNSLSYDLGRDIGINAPRTRHVEVFRNQDGGSLQAGDYMGVYILVESVKRDENRVDIPVLNASDTTEPDISGGYILRFEKGVSVSAARLSGWSNLELHRYDEYTAQQKTWISNYVNQLDSVIFGSSFKDPDTGYAKYIDVGSFVDNLVINELTRDQDAYVRSAYLYKDRGGKLAWGPLWDYNLTMDTGCCFDNRNTRGWQFDQNYNSSEHGWNNRLFEDPDFCQEFVDRWYEVRQNELDMTDLYNRIDAHADPLQEAQQRNFEKWDILDDSHVGFPTPATDTWEEQIDVIKDWLDRRITWIDDQFRAVPQFSRNSGQISPGSSLTMTMPSSGSIYYTTDGTDPRASGGGIGSSAIAYTGSPVILNNSTQVIARVRDTSVSPSGTDLVHTQWSAPTEAVFVIDTPADAGNLVISEINYNPADPTPAELDSQPLQDPDYTSDDFEFIELLNVGDETIALGGVRFVDGIDFRFALGDTIAPGQRAVVVCNEPAFEVRYGTGLPILGQYGAAAEAKKLSNGGEAVKLENILGDTILEFDYNDSGAWPGRADGKGATLELIDPEAVPDTDSLLRTEYLEDGDHWRAGVAYGGTPGDEPELNLGVVINEVLTHTDWPGKDTIELYNTTDGWIDIDGWYLSDSWGWESSENNGNYKKFCIPDETSVPPYGYVIFSEDDFNPTWDDPNPDPGPNDFALSGAHGDQVWLMETDGTGELAYFADYVEFGGAFNGESFGRWPNGEGVLYPMISTTLDKEHPENGLNSGPRLGEVIVSELHYNPLLDEEDDDLEFIEIYNVTGDAVDLTDWRIRKGIDFDFPDGTVLQGHCTLVVLPFAPGDAEKWPAFCARYGLAEDETEGFLGGYSGQLRDNGERVQLQRPDEEPQNEPGYVPHVLEDEVRYDDEQPWPGVWSHAGAADGQSDSLNRLRSNQWGNEAANWYADWPTPGETSVQPAAQIAGRHLFYSGSAFDGNGISTGKPDDGAIAPDKDALLPGETATLANYTSYDLGINGVMIDVHDLAGAPMATDFEFHVGNDNASGQWAEADGLLSITVRQGDGDGGSDRVTINFNDGEILNQWLRVKVLATTNTGLVKPDVFYFGNAVGESGNSIGDARVNAADVLATRNNPRGFLNAAPINFRYDFNRDRRVNATDMLLARSNQTHFLNALKLITVPGEAGKGEKSLTMMSPEQALVSSLARLDIGDDTAKIRRASALDSVLEEAAGRGLSSRETPSAELEWFYDLKLASTPKRPAKKDNSAKEAVDGLFIRDPLL